MTVGSIPTVSVHLYKHNGKNHTLTKNTLVTVGVNSEGPPDSALHHFPKVGMRVG
jgi:hypothetical protein